MATDPIPSREGSRPIPVIPTVPPAAKAPGRVADTVGGVARRSSALMAPRTNGIIDYVVAVALMFAPWVLTYPDQAVPPVSRALGAMLFFYAFCTKYDLGVLRFIPLQI